MENNEEEIHASVMEYLELFENNFKNLDRHYQKQFWDVFYPDASDKLSKHVILPSWYIKQNI